MEEEQLEERLLALRQTPNKGRGHAWRVEHRAVGTELEEAWARLQGHVRQLDETLCHSMDDWDRRNLAVSDNIMLADHVIEAIKRLREAQQAEQALSQSPIADEPRARFNAWWLRP